MDILRTIEETRAWLSPRRRAGERIGFFPTLGALHEGHLSLIRQCRAECDVAVVSIFLNPTQFGPQEDLAKYPQTFEADAAACRAEGVDLIFAPGPEEMYPLEKLTWVTVERLSEHLCGAKRPGHFRGVCTVVAKLFNIIHPDVAYFAQKDAQQLAIICRMVEELNFPIEIRKCPTVREADGLAMSSRNVYLTGEQRRQTICLNKALNEARQLFENGLRDTHTIIAAMTGIIRDYAPDAKIDYISIVDNELLQPLTIIDKPALIALAVKIGSTRLIDNIVVDPARKT